jgi:hypothetical protein
VGGWGLYSGDHDLKEHNRVLKHDLNEISSRSHYTANVVNKDQDSEKDEMLQEITSLQDHIQTLEEYNEILSPVCREMLWHVRFNYSTRPNREIRRGEVQATCHPQGRVGEEGHLI